MKKTSLLFILVFLTYFSGTLLVHAADLSCQQKQEGTQVFYFCGIVSGMEFPGNCVLEGAAQLKCSGEPNGYTCSGEGCNVVPPFCTSTGSGYNCTLPISGKLPQGCTSSGGGMRCTNVPTNYTVRESSTTPSPTSVTPGALSNTSQQISTPRPGDSLQYIPLEPIPGLVEGNLANVSFPELIGTIFKIIFTLAGLLAVVVLVIGGIQYMVTDVVSLKLIGKQKIEGALWGLGILAASWLILYTINPDLLNLDLKVVTTNSGGSQNTPSYNTANSNTNTTSGTNTNGNRSPFSSYPAGSNYAASLVKEYNKSLVNTEAGVAMLIAKQSVDVLTNDTYKNFYNQCTKVGTPYKKQVSVGIAYFCLKK